jgi:hypothetical protein
MLEAPYFIDFKCTSCQQESKKAILNSQSPTGNRSNILINGGSYCRRSRKVTSNVQFAKKWIRGRRAVPLAASHRRSC